MNIISDRPDVGLSAAFRGLMMAGESAPSRNGDVLVITEPVVIAHVNPLQRVIFSPKRDANPFFHLFEALWMLSGRNDVFFPSQFNSNIKNYSDNGVIFNGAYGYRWSNHFEGIDQIGEAIKILKEDPTSRRVVIAMWDPYADLGVPSKDLPFNTHIYLLVNNGALHMTVCNRSNDAVWGAFGANVVHMSILHEYLAEQMGYSVGRYYQFTNNLHIYEKHWDMMRSFSVDVNPYPGYNRLDRDEPGWFDDLLSFIHRYDQLPKDYKSEYFRYVVAPLGHAWWNYKGGRIEAAVDFARQCLAPDWSKAGVEWLRRRIK